jgi:hypothetical protein
MIDTGGRQANCGPIAIPDSTPCQTCKAAKDYDARAVEKSKTDPAPRDPETTYPRRDGAISLPKTDRLDLTLFVRLEIRPTLTQPDPGGPKLLSRISQATDPVSARWFFVFMIGHHCRIQPSPYSTQASPWYNNKISCGCLYPAAAYSVCEPENGPNSPGFRRRCTADLIAGRPASASAFRCSAGQLPWKPL